LINPGIDIAHFSSIPCNLSAALRYAHISNISISHVLTKCERITKKV